MTIPKHMKAARVAERGGDLRIETVETPEPGPGQVLIRVESAGVNFSDVKRRRGDTYPFETAFPYVPGGEVAGTIVAHGPGVSGPPIGTPVFALAGTNGFGGYAQFAVSYAQTAAPVPKGLSLDAASVMLVAGSTARLMLTETARLQKGESVLVPSATGGVGSFLVSIARLLGASKIVAAVGDESKRKAALALGAHEVVVTSQADWPERVRAVTNDRGVDVALEATGGPELAQTFRCLAPFGRLVVFGAASGTNASLDPATLERLLYAPAANQSIAGFNLGSWFMDRPAVAGQALGALVEDVLAERIRLPALHPMPLADAARAHLSLEGRTVQGKIVLKPWA